VPTPETAGGEKLKTVPTGNAAEFLVQSIFIFLILFRAAFALAQGFNGNEKKLL